MGIWSKWESGRNSSSPDLARSGLAKKANWMEYQVPGTSSSSVAVAIALAIAVAIAIAIAIKIAIA